MSEKDEILTNGEPTGEGLEEASKSSDKGNQKRWYIVHTYSGYENKVKSNLEKRIEYMNMQHGTISSLNDFNIKPEAPDRKKTRI